MSDQQPPSTAVTTNQKSAAPAQRLKGLLDTDAIRERFHRVLGQKSEAFTSSIVSAVSMNPYLQKCEPMSIIQSAMIAATLDLPINPSLGLAHIVPYKDVAAFQMGWKGYVQLGMRSGQYKTMNAAVVYEGQLVDHNPFTGEMRFQQKALSDKKIGYLFYFKLLNGFEKYTYMTADDVQKHAKRYSATYQRGMGPWTKDFDAMALKTVVKQGLSKWGVLSIEMQKAVEYDETDGAEVPSHPDSTENNVEENTPTTEKKSRLAKIVETKAAPKEPINHAVPGAVNHAVIDKPVSVVNDQGAVNEDEVPI